MRNLGTSLQMKYGSIGVAVLPSPEIGCRARLCRPVPHPWCLYPCTFEVEASVLVRGQGCTRCAMASSSSRTYLCEDWCPGGSFAPSEARSPTCGVRHRGANDKQRSLVGQTARAESLQKGTQYVTYLVKLCKVTIGFRSNRASICTSYSKR